MIVAACARSTEARNHCGSTSPYWCHQPVSLASSAIPTTAATSPGSAPYRVSRSTMSRSLKPTWPFSSRWIFHSEARIASPACSREMPASMRSRRSRDPTSMRRTVGPPGACCVIEAAYSRAGAGGRSPGSGTRRLGAKGVGRDLAVGARGASTWRPAGTAGARTGAQRDLLEEQRHQEGEHDERHPHEKDVVQGVGEGAEHEVAHGTGEPLDGLDVVGVYTGGYGPRLHARLSELLGQVVGEPAGQHRAEHGRADRAAHLAEERGRAGGRPHVTKLYRVLDGCHDRLQGEAQAGAEQVLVQGHLPERRVHGEPGQQEHGEGQHHAADDRV